MIVPLKDSDVNSLCIRFMNKLIQKIQEDEKARVYKDSLYQEACVDHNAETGGHDYTNSTLKNRVIDELLERGDIMLGLAKLKLLNKERTNQNIN
jgi:hypothetical protein